MKVSGKHWSGIRNMDGYKASWYKEWFGEDYLTVYKHRDNNDARRLTALIVHYCSPKELNTVLDLACGNGRHSFLLAKHFKHVIGLDLSRHLLDRARRARKNGDACPCFVRADMRLLPFKGHFDLVASLFTSFGYFDDDGQHRRVAEEISRVLKQGGYFVMDYFNADYVKQHLVPEGERIMEGMLIREKRWIEKGRVFKKITIEKNGRPKSFYEAVRMFSREEMVTMFSRAGIEIRHIFGDYDGSPFTSRAPRMILFGNKK